MKKVLVAFFLILCITMSSVAFASTKSIEKINYNLNPNILSGTFEIDWNKGTVPRFHDYDVYACMEVMLRLNKKSSANCTVGVGVRKFSGSSGTVVSYALKSFNASNTTNDYKFYPSSSTTYSVAGDISFTPAAGTYAYVAKSNGPSNLAGRYAGYMSDRLG